MAQLPTPTVSGSFASASRVDGTATWASAVNLDDLDQVRVRYLRHLSSTSPPSASTVGSQSESTSWRRGSLPSGWTYKDDVVRSGFDNSPPTYTDRTVSFSEASLTNYNVWAMSRLEV